MSISLHDNELRVSRSTLRELALETLREAIVTLRFKPGDRLVERELCELTGVSRTCIREALRSLESEGLVTSVAHRGPTVATLSLREAQEIYEVRAVLEALAGELFARRATPEHLDKLSDAQTLYAEAIVEKNVPIVLRSLSEFYAVLFDGAGNITAAKVIQSLQARMQYLRATTTMSHSVSDSRRSVQNFRRIVRQAKRRDAKATALACRAQVEQAAQIAMRVLAANSNT